LARWLLPLVGVPRESSSLGGGGWQGNDTLWRTILDINRCLFYFDRTTKCIGLQPDLHFKYFAILDGLIGGEKESPLSPTPVKSGLMMAAFNPLALDAVMAAMMGLDVSKLPQIVQGFSTKSLPLASFVLENVEIYEDETVRRIKDIYQGKQFCRFEPSQGFRGYVEYPG
jgi:hypothetical protein